MNRCYDSLDERFVCQLKKIKCAFACAVFAAYKEKRYGIAPCVAPKDQQQMADLLALMEYTEMLDISQFDYNTFRNSLYKDDMITRMVTDHCLPSFSMQTLEVCNISNILETINSL